MSTNEADRSGQLQRVDIIDPLHSIEPFHTSNDGIPDAASSGEVGSALNVEPDAEHVSEWERLNAVQLPEIGGSNRPTGKKDPRTP